MSVCKFFLTYKFPHIFKLRSPSFVLFIASIRFNCITASKPLWSIVTVKENYIKIFASRPRCLLICRFSLSRHISHIYIINPSFICFNSLLQINLTVLQYLNNYEASHTSRWPTLPSQPVARNAVLNVSLYKFCWHIIFHIFST